MLNLTTLGTIHKRVYVAACALGCILPACADGVAQDNERVAAAEAGLYYGILNRWTLTSFGNPDGIGVCFTNLASYPTEASWVKEAVLNTWDRYSAINFTGFAQCPAGSFRGLWVTITTDSGSQSGIGMPAFGQQYVSVNAARNFPPGHTCTLDPKRCVQAGAIHEFGHALSFRHEYERPDLPPDCMPGQPRPTPIPDYIAVGAYDRFSVMNGSAVCSLAPYATALSATDILGVQQAYGTQAQRLALVNPSVSPYEWNIDVNGNTAIEFGIDRRVHFGTSGQGVAGAFGSSSNVYIDRIGTFDNGVWQIDWNNNGAWDGAGVDRQCYFGSPGDVPVPGRYLRGSSGYPALIAVYRAGTFFVDWNNSGSWDGAGTDRQFVYLSYLSGDMPVVGAWTSPRIDFVGIYNNGMWYLDANGDNVFGSGDRVYSFNPAGTGARPMPADYNGDGIADIAVFRGGGLWIDWNNNGVWDGTSVDRFYNNVFYLPVPGLFSAI